MNLGEFKSDSILSEKISKGNVEAYDQAFNKYGSRLFGFALSYLKSKEEAEELVQEVFLKIWENRKNLKKENSLKSYLFTIAYHEMCGIFRRKKIHEKFLLSIDTNESLDVDLEERLVYKDSLIHIDKLINKLPQKQKIIFIKSRKEGKSTKEIASEMNLAPGTVDNQISAALKFLRKHITEKNFALFLFFIVFIQ